MTAARHIRVRGIVQGVGFRPFVFRLAAAHGLLGWVRNATDGVRIHVEGDKPAMEAFLRELESDRPAACRIDALDVAVAKPGGFSRFRIRPSARDGAPRVRIAPDRAVCQACLAELFDPADRRYGYPYITCTACGPRYSIVLALPYDRANTTMRAWPLCSHCRAEYGDPLDRRFHAEPLACPACGPGYAGGVAAFAEAARALRAGQIVAVKGIGGYHLACDARAVETVSTLRERKYRKERPFALMARDLDVARGVIALTPEREAVLTSAARPIVLAPPQAELPGIAPGSPELGVMLPYAPPHYLLFAAGAPDLIVLTSGNRSSEPIAYRDDDARERLTGLADAWLVGERPIARRVDDSVARVGALGPVVLRRARGYAPDVVARLPTTTPILAVGADLKSAPTLVIGGEAIVAQHLGDLEHEDARRALAETVRDLLDMHSVRAADLCVAYDAHPEYASTAFALELPAKTRLTVQHHRAHIASVLAERGALDTRVVGVACDGTGYGDDGTIWGGELFVGSVREGLRRTAHLRPAWLPGGDAAARYPAQAAAGFLADLDDDVSDIVRDERYVQARRLIGRQVRMFRTTSVGRLFDAMAALVGFTREATYEGQAAVWLEHLSRTAPAVEPYPVPFDLREIDYRPMLRAAIADRRRGRNVAEIALAFHRGLAAGIGDAILALASESGTTTAVLSGGVFQNDLLLGALRDHLAPTAMTLWTNGAVPPNDGGVSLGQAAIAACTVFP